MMRRFLPYLLFALLLAGFCYKLVFTDLILARGDTYTYFYPYWDARNAALRAGEWPLWSPDIFMGVPLLANPQVGTFYPPNWLTLPWRAPDAVRWSIVWHLLWMGAGTMVLYRAVISENWLAALLAGVLFTLGGYTAAHMEQINQLQGLSWLPWLLWCFHQSITAHARLRWSVLLALLLALQLFSGHTQTVFISGFALGCYALYRGLSAPPRLSASGRYLLRLALASALALLLALPQLLPTLELTGMSNRGGGFTPQEATAFSLPPSYIGRSLLPSYDGQLFSEYIGMLGVLGLGLALIGALSPAAEQGRERRFWVVLCGLGLLLALGRFTPVYWLLAELPGFNLFRVPARWLALFALGAALLAGIGLESISRRAVRRRGAALAGAVLLALMLVGYLAPINPADVVGFAQPTRATLAGWGIAFVGWLLLVWVGLQGASGLQAVRAHPAVPWVIVGLAVLELFAATRILPYNHLVPREVYEGQRFTISQMLAYAAESTPPPRMLSISDLRFDPGDRAQLQARYDELGLDVQAAQTAFTAVKRQEVIAPNLPLTWGIPSIDGYGGGVLPTVYYAQFTSLLLPEGAMRTVDGRLGEMLASPQCRGACLPRPDATGLAWPLLLDVGYIITDKIYDVVHEGIFYDTTLEAHWEAQGIAFDDGGFDFTAMYVLHTGDLTEDFIAVDETLRVAVLDADQRAAAGMLDLDGVNVLAVTLVDERTGAFQQVQPRYFDVQRVLSSDIKLYQLNAAVRSRAYLVTGGVPVLPDDWDGHEEALTLLRTYPAVIHGDAEPLQAQAPPQDWLRGEVQFVEYSAKRIEMRVYAEADSYLILSDAHYPGWRARLNGQETSLYRANVMFRAVRVPEGEHTLVFEFVPTLWYRAMWAGALVWAVALAVLLVRR